MINVSIIYVVYIVNNFISDGIEKHIKKFKKPHLIYVDGLFVYLILYMYFCLNIIFYETKPSFWKLPCLEFGARCRNGFSSVLLNHFSNFRNSLLEYLRENCFRKLKKILISDERLWLFILDRAVVSIRVEHNLEVVVKVFIWYYLCLWV